MRKPFFKKSHRAYYVWHQGRLIRLDADREAAIQKYHELMSSGAPALASDSVASLLNAYLDWCKKNRAEATYVFYRTFLSSFARSIGVRLRIGSLQPLHITQWLDAHPKWDATTRFNAVRCAKRAFNWAIKEGRLTVSPLRNVERPRPNRREAFVTREQFRLILSNAKGQCFQELLTFLYETGCRIQEARIIEARHCDLDARRIVLPASQAKGKRFPRVIYFHEDLASMIAERIRLFPTGPIFRNQFGLPWCKDSINCRMKRIRKRLSEKHPEMAGLCATALRHGFATEALKNGVDPVTVSILMGHSDATQVARTYQHLAADPRFLAQALKKATGKAS